MKRLIVIYLIGCVLAYGLGFGELTGWSLKECDKAYYSHGMHLADCRFSATLAIFSWLDVVAILGHSFIKGDLYAPRFIPYSANEWESL